MSGVERMSRYVSDVLNNRILTNVYLKQACQRHLDDLKRVGQEDFPYVFDEEKANKFIAFAECLKQYQDKFRGVPLKYEDWQCFIFCSLYGWVHKDTGYRRFRKAFIFVSRKNGKSTMCGASLIWDALTTNGGQSLCCATKREQSRIVWAVAKEMIKQNEALMKRFKIYNSTFRLINPALTSYIEALSADSDSADGLSPSLIVADEVSAMKDYSIISVLTSGAGARPESLCLEITSGSDNMESAGYSEFSLGKEILAGIKKDDSQFYALYCLDENDNWTDPKNFIKANPNMGVSISEEWLLKQQQEAMNNPRLEGEFRCKNLNQWLNPLTAWIKPKTWSEIMKNAETYKFDPEKSYTAVAAVDLSQRRDLTTYTICFFQDSYYFFKHYFYFPQDAIQDKLAHSSDLWRHWMDKGLVTATPGDSINYEWLFHDIRESLKKYTIDCICYDPYNSQSLISEFDGEIPLVEVNQNMKTMSPFTKSYEEEIYKKTLVDDNPVLQWMHFNCRLYSDPNGNIKAVKEKVDSEKKIDGIVTSVMCVGYIRSLIDSHEIDLRTPEEVYAQTSAFLKSLGL